MRRAAGIEPFYGVIPLTTVALFVLNNFWLKSALPGDITGKLSDVCACFFVPLFIAALLRQLTSWELSMRLHYGAAVMVVGLVLFKGSAWASDWLNTLIAQATAWSGLTLRPNVADPTDLYALPIVALSYICALRVQPESLGRTVTFPIASSLEHDTQP